MAEVKFQKSEVIQAVAEKIIDEHYPADRQLTLADVGATTDE